MRGLKRLSGRGLRPWNGKSWRPLSGTGLQGRDAAATVTLMSCGGACKPPHGWNANLVHRSQSYLNTCPDALATLFRWLRWLCSNREEMERRLRAELEAEQRRMAELIDKLSDPNLSDEERRALLGAEKVRLVIIRFLSRFSPPTPLRLLNNLTSPSLALTDALTLHP